MVNSVPFVSVVVPCRDEGTWIAACLESIADNDYPKERMEVLVVDGMSGDETRSMIATFAAQHPWTRLLDNPKKTAPVALNIGIAGRQRLDHRPNGRPRRVSDRLYLLAGATVGGKRRRQRGRRLPDPAGQRDRHGRGNRHRHVASAGRRQLLFPHRLGRAAMGGYRSLRLLSQGGLRSHRRVRRGTRAKPRRRVEPAVDQAWRANPVVAQDRLPLLRTGFGAQTLANVLPVRLFQAVWSCGKSRQS